MDIKNKLEILDKTEAEARLGGGKNAIARQHTQGKLTARERVDLFFDKGTFVELDMLAQHQCHDFGMEKTRPLGDAIITGYGNANGRLVFLYAYDFTVMGGSMGFTTVAKFCSLSRLARKVGAPIVGLFDSVGGRIQEGSGHSAGFFENVFASGAIPQISAVMGNCAGAGVYQPALTDFTFMVRGTSQMFITGPRVIKEVSGEDISIQELGGAKPHSEVSGVCDVVAGSDEECLQMIRRLLGYLPSNYLEKPPLVDTGDDPGRCNESLLDIVPENRRAAYDMRNIITRIADNGEFFEIKKAFARNMITGFARLGGHSVGIVANQPMVLAGCLDCDASDKAGRFYRFCDCFNIPIITLVDVPGYLPGAQQEYKGIIRHGAKMLYGFAEATVPKITCIIRKAFGGSYDSMGAKAMGADIVLAWPSAEIAIMGAEAAVTILHRKEIEAAEDSKQLLKQKIEEYREKFGSPYHAASKQFIDVIIKPQETRPQLIKALKVLQNKCQETQGKRHGNIPL